MITKIIKTNLDWNYVKNLCRSTMNKPPTDVPATKEFKRKLLIAEHTPITTLTISWIWEHIPYWVSVHFARHWLGWLKFISTSRTDRTNINREDLPQSHKVKYHGEANVQALINVAKKRLCFQSSDTTRQYMEDLKNQLYPIDTEIANVLVPSCIYRGGCPEIAQCKELFYNKFLNYVSTHNLKIDTIQQRYDAYNLFYKERNKLNV